jgi:hypothetical protein
MPRSFALTFFLAAAAVGGLLPAPARAQDASPLGGVWTLNRSLSEFPAEIGFNPAWMTAATGDGRGGASSGGGGGRGRRGAGGGGGSQPTASPFAGRPESYEDARLLQALTTEARTPPARLMIVETPVAVTITNELGQSRTVHPDGKQESIEIQGVSVGVTSTRDGNRLTVLYRLGASRELRYTYSATANPSRLVVELQFLERGAGDKATRVYEPGVVTETAASTGPPTAAPPSGASPAQPAAEAFDQRPGAELRGLKSLGVLVENLSATATACGLNRETIESALAKRLTDGGFTVRRNSDEDTYVYVNVMTTSGFSGQCVTRYDAFLYTQATARLSYRDQPVLVQVSLMHRGGMSSTASTAHAASVGRGLEAFIDLFVTQIRDANK